MASGIVYLDVDDEITSAAARIRGSEATKVALVAAVRLADRDVADQLPAAVARGARQQAAAVDRRRPTRRRGRSRPRPGCRSSRSVAEYEASLARADDVAGTPPTAGRRRPPPRDGRRRRAAGRGRSRAADAAGRRGDRSAPPPTGSRTGLAADAASRRRGRATTPQLGDAAGRRRRDGRDAAAARRDRRDARRVRGRPVPAASPPTRGRPAARRIGSALPVIRSRPTLRDRHAAARHRRGAALALAVVVAGVAAYVFLPSADDRGHAAREPIGPISLVVVADPDATAPDADVDPPVVPAGPARRAGRRSSDTFTTTGQARRGDDGDGRRSRSRTSTSRRRNTIPRGSIVSTEAGVRFRTDEPVTVAAGRARRACRSSRPRRDVRVDGRRSRARPATSSRTRSRSSPRPRIR